MSRSDFLNLSLNLNLFGVSSRDLQGKRTEGQARF
jgi:hypothetical protein